MDAAAAGSSGCGDGGCGSCGTSTSTSNSTTDTTSKRRGSRPGARTCTKCKPDPDSPAPAQAMANQTEAVCPGCLHRSLLGKFKAAASTHGLFAPGDKLLVAFSGGPASRVALDFALHAQADARRRRRLPLLHVAAAFIDESAAAFLEPGTPTAVEAVRAAVASAGEGALVPLHVAPLESALSGNPGGAGGAEEQQQQLRELLAGVEDPTGREDLQELLRARALQALAREHGYTRVVSGLCATRVAARVVADTAKGRGFALPAAVQYVDARWEVPLVFPLRDCVARELALHCHFAKLKTVFVRKLWTMAGDCSSINSLAHSFVALLQEENPAREHTIVRTASKLKPFEFNRIDSSSDALGTSRRRRPPRQQQQHDCLSPEQSSSSSHQEEAAVLLCPLCHAPLDTRDFPYPAAAAAVPAAASPAQAFRDSCCPSCRYQILTQDNLVSTFSLLPALPKHHNSSSTTTLLDRRNWMRSQVAEYLI